jgi:hypothetical protein
MLIAAQCPAVTRKHDHLALETFETGAHVESKVIDRFLVSGRQRGPADSR